MDLVVHNDLDEIDRGRGMHRFVVFTSGDKPQQIEQSTSASELPLALERAVKRSFL